jgi:Bacterial capsule synthesis protein PGA_cap
MSAFPGGAPVRPWVLIAAALASLMMGGCPAASPPEAGATTVGGPTITIAFGGDLLLGEDMNTYVQRNGPVAPLAEVPQLREADISIVNLESVVAGGGDAIDSGRVEDYYFLGRPETLAVLPGAGIDGVLTGNNHALDFGPAALIEEGRILASMGLAHPGTGSNRAEACAPAFFDSQGTRIALFSIDTTEPRYRAGDGQPGTCFVAPHDRAGWDGLRGPIADAHTKAHVVLAAPHFRATFSTTPLPSERDAARSLIDIGADAVLGSGAHALQGIESYRERPILYDAGSLLFNFPQPSDAAIFLLTAGSAGVTGLRTLPIVTEHDRTRPADAIETSRILAAVDDRSRELGTQTGQGTLDFMPGPRNPPSVTPQLSRLNPDSTPGPLTEPPASCAVSSVPSAALLPPTSVGPLTLVGTDVQPARLEGPAVIWVETFWTIGARTSADLSLMPRATPINGQAWGGPHEPCDWAWPTTRWRPGVVYRDRYPLRPPPQVQSLAGIPALMSGVGYGQLSVSIGVADEGRLLGDSVPIASLALEAAPRARLLLAATAAAAVMSIVALMWWFRRRRRVTRR